MKHKTFLAVAVFIFTVLTAGAYGSSSSDSQTFTFSEYPWVNSNIIGRVPESYRPSPQEDFYVWKNHDWLVSTSPVEYCINCCWRRIAPQNRHLSLLPNGY